MHLNELLSTLDHIVADRFGVLDPGYIQDLLLDVNADLEAELQNFGSIRYALIDPEAGQLESRRLFESYHEAEQAARDAHDGQTDIALVVN